MISKKASLIGLALLVPLAGVGAAVARRPAAGPLLHAIALGTDLTSVAVDGATGHAFVVDRNTNGYTALGQGTVSLVDTRAGKVVRTTPVGPDPREAVLDARDGRVLVVNDDNASVSVLDARSGLVVGVVRVGSHPHNVAVDARTDRAFVVNSGDGSVSVLDARRAVVLRTVRLAGDFALSGVAVDGRTGHVFVGDSTGAASLMHVLDTNLVVAAHAAARDATVRSYAAGSYSSGLGAMDHMVVDSLPVAGSPDGRVFFVSGAGVSVLDARTRRTLRMVSVGGTASAVAVDPRRHRVYVTSIVGVNADGAPAGPGP